MTRSRASRTALALLLVSAVLFVTTCAVIIVAAPAWHHSEVGGHVFAVLYYAGIAVSATAMFVRAARTRTHRLPWYCFALSASCWLLGDIAWYFVASHRDPAPPTSVGDIGYLLFFPFAYVGIALLVRERTGRLPAATWLDGVIVGLGFGAVAASFLFEPVVERGAGRLPLLSSNLVYPIADLVLMAVVVTTLALLRWRARMHWWLLLAGFSILALTDSRYLVELAEGTHHHPSLTDMGWPLAFLTVAAAAATKVPLQAPLPRRSVNPVLPLLTATGALAVLLQPGVNLGSLGGLLAAGTIVLTLARLALTVRESERLAEAHRQARTDELTGLPNWRTFYDRVGKLADSTSAGPRQQAVLLLDLDRFKEVNDSLGHLMGDELLRLVGPRLAAQLHSSDTIARLGGDEFGVALTGHDPGDPSDVAERLCRALDEPFELGGVTVQVGVSIGIALSPQDGVAPTQLLQRADVAMYAAKRAREDWRAYVASEDPNSLDRLRRLEKLRTMLRGDGQGLVVHYQPKISLRDGLLTGVEALVRWQHPDQGLLAPGAFLDLVEENGLARPLTEHVLDRALHQAAAWRKRGLDVPVAVNLSATTVIDAELPQMVADRLRRHGLPASSLELEITEAFLMSDWVRARAVLDELRGLGILISVDDFGTGYSSLSYLRDLPIDQLKLDRTFITRMDGDETAAALVRSTVSLAHSLGLEMVAEGVESAEVLARLASFGCDQAQGFHIGRPMPAEQVARWSLERDIGPVGLVGVRPSR